MKMDKERKELYDTLANEMPLVREVLDGTTTFAESLDQIAAAIEEHDDPAADAFAEWYVAAGSLTAPPLSQDEAMVLVEYALINSKSVSKTRNITDAVRVGLGGAAFAVGSYLKRAYWRIGTLYQIGGVSLAGSAAYTHVRGRLKAKSDKVVMEGYLDRMMATAKELDKEVQEVFFPVNEEPVSVECCETLAEPAENEVA